MCETAAVQCNEVWRNGCNNESQIYVTHADGQQWNSSEWKKIENFRKQNGQWQNVTLYLQWDSLCFFKQRNIVKSSFSVGSRVCSYIRARVCSFIDKTMHKICVWIPAGELQCLFLYVLRKRIFKFTAFWNPMSIIRGNFIRPYSLFS